ncbi:sugar ABC transporter permease [Paenibacillus psychroresistens]|uniref:Sugar ABC transporter permease n=1 Tax=Paenibacillus psychroresistens TaxID=1778678 RepID=A0A6B8RPN3_9BACL|nr:sugar ABC transporter permease [Paenibacillus psychroresistens]QGQ97774.1 sugar ABC transporter permease [Paenibacillus psychroresistens]
MLRKARARLDLLVFILPTILIFTVVVIYSTIQTFYSSFFDWDGLSTAKFIFLDNYKRIFEDPLFYISNKNQVIFAIGLGIYQIGVGGLLAFLLSSKKIFGRKLFKSFFFIPVTLSIVVVSQLWVSIYSYDFGLINKALEWLGINYRQSWLSDSNTSIYAIVFANAWQYMGINMLLIYAGIKAIPEQYFEAATIDGANTFQTHLKITIPLLQETLKLCLIISLTGGFTAFTNMYLMTNGGPGNVDYTLTFMMYSSAFKANEYGYGSTAATLLILQCIALTVVINRFVAREKITY